MIPRSAVAPDSKWQGPTSIDGPSAASPGDEFPMRGPHAKFIQDLLTDGWIYIPVGPHDATHNPIVASADLISFVDPPPMLQRTVDKHADEPVVMGSIQSIKSGRSILVQSYTVSESSKSDKIVDILVSDASADTGTESRKQLEQLAFAL